MHIYTDVTAYRYLRNSVMGRSRFDWKQLKRSSCQDAILRAARTGAHEEIAAYALQSSLGAPLHFLVPQARLRRESELVSSHVWSRALPPGSLIQMGDEMCVCSPEFFLLQKAANSTFPELLVFTELLFGKHYLTNLPRRETGCLPFSNRFMLSRYASECRGLPGSQRLRDAARFALENEASLPEGVLGALCSLPARKGGFGFKSLELNFEVETPLGADVRFGKPRRSCDLYIPELMLDIEYESDEHHSSDAERKGDAVRRNQLEMQGVSVMSITSNQLYDFGSLLAIGENLHQRLKLRWEMTDAWRMRVAQLHRDLLNAMAAARSLA